MTLFFYNGGLWKYPPLPVQIIVIFFYSFPESFIYFIAYSVQFFEILRTFPVFEVETFHAMENINLAIAFRDFHIVEESMKQMLFTLLYFFTIIDGVDIRFRYDSFGIDFHELDRAEWGMVGLPGIRVGGYTESLYHFFDVATKIIFAIDIFFYHF